MASDWSEKAARELRELAEAIESGEVKGLVCGFLVNGAMVLHGSAERGVRDGVTTDLARALVDWVEFPHVIQGEA